MIDFHEVQFDMPEGLQYWIPALADPFLPASYAQVAIEAKLNELDSGLRQLDPTNPAEMALQYAVLTAGINLLRSVQTLLLQVNENLRRAQLGGDSLDGE